MSLRVTLLGGFEVTVDGKVVERDEWASRRAAQLVALLALAPSRRLTTEQVMDGLWPDLAPGSARANLHKAASLARQAMGSKESVVLRSDTVTLGPGTEVEVDVVEFDAAADRALAAAEPAECARVARRFGGDLLPDDRYESWVVERGGRVRRLYLDLLRSGRLWSELSEADPTDEAAHRGLMEEHLQAGRLNAAIRQFQRLRSILAREVGALPSPSTVALYRQILGTATSGWVRPGLVGREAELVRARATLRRAAEGRPAAIFLTGPAGIGKTRFCEELIEQAVDDGWLVLRAGGREQTASVPYWALIEAVQSLLVDRPYLANALGDPERALLARLAGLPAADEQAVVHRHAVLHLVSRLVDATKASRAMLVLDDLHHVDDDSIGLASLLASASSPRGAFLLGAYRQDAGDSASAMAADLIARGVGVAIELGALSRSGTDAIVNEVLERPATPAELDLAWQLSDGNPFFALEVAATLSSDEASPAGGAYGAVDTRLARLPAPVRKVLATIAVVASDFTADEAATVASVPPDHALEHLDVAMAAGVVACEGSSYRFRHDLIRDRLVAPVPEAERRSAHSAAADGLAALGAPPARVAHHLLAAGRDDDALEWLRRAAGEAIGLGAYADALVAADRALTIATRDATFLALRADAMNGLGDPGAPGAYSVAMAVAPEPERAALAVRRTKALLLAGDVPSAVEALAAIGPVPSEVIPQLEVVRGLASWCMGALDEAEAAGQRAKHLAQETGSVRDFVDATLLLAMVAHQQGGWPQRLSLDLLDTHLLPDLSAVVIDAHLCVAESYLYGGVPYPEVIAFAGDLQREAAASGAPRAEAFAMTLLGEAHLLMGDTEAATHHLRAAAERYGRMGVLVGEGVSLQRLAQALFAAGADADAREAQAALHSALIAARGSPVGTRHLLDRVHGTAIRFAADPSEALAAVDEAARGVRGPLETCPACAINLTVPAAIACAGAGDLVRAEAYLAGSEQIAAAFYPRGGWPAALDEVRAHVSMAKGDPGAAGRLLDAAIGTFDNLGQHH